MIFISIFNNSKGVKFKESNFTNLIRKKFLEIHPSNTTMGEIQVASLQHAIPVPFFLDCIVIDQPGGRRFLDETNSNAFAAR